MWFTVCLMFEAVATPDDHDALWEEMFVLIKAESEEDAIEKAKERAKQEEQSYISMTDHKIDWTFRTVQGVCMIDEDKIGHGTELFSRFLRESEAKSLMTVFEDEEE